ncbi:MAG: PTS sugar transporter subunit IIA, partial [Bacteroidota bacterium]|jgi:mannitol/fructose-specific phosphotransferase system IIA component (Ntr-type)
VIRELSAALATVTGLSEDLIAGKVIDREKTMATGIGRRVAIPHARMDGLISPAIAVGYAKDGIDFDAPDGLPAKVILLVLTPKDEFQRQLQILAEVGKLFRSERAVERVLRTQSFVELLALIKSEERGQTAQE